MGVEDGVHKIDIAHKRFMRILKGGGEGAK
jgi:hypothetical protein